MRCVQHYLNVTQRLQEAKNRSPTQIWARNNIQHNINNAVPFGVPIYFLENRLQQGQPIGKWENRSRIGMYLGKSVKHARILSLILNLETGLVSQ